MPPPAPGRLRRFCRLVFRVTRTTFVVLLIVGVSLAVYLNRWGLPAPLEQMLVAELRARGVELTFSRLRLSWSHGIVAENVSFGRAATPATLPAEKSAQAGPLLYATKAQLRFNHEALRRLELVLDGVKLREGRLDLPVTSAGQRPRHFTVLNLHAELWFRPGDEWELRNLEGRALGVMIKLSGTLTNASRLRAWTWPQRPKETERATNFWYRLVGELERVKAAPPAELTGTFSADARDVSSFNLKLILNTPGLNSPWGSGKNVLLSTSLIPAATSNDWPRVEFNVHADHTKTRWGQAEALRLNGDFAPLLVQQWLTNAASDGAASVALAPSLPQPWLANGNLRVHLKAAQTRWGRAENFRLEARVQPDGSDTNLFHTDLKLIADRIHTDWRGGTNWIDAGNGQLTARLSQTPTSLVPLVATGQVEVADARTSWGAGEQARIRFASQRVGTNALVKAASLEEWIRLAESFTLDWETELSRVQSPKLQLEFFFATGKWRDSELRADELKADLYGGHVNTTARLNTASRVLSLSGHSDFDVHKISSLLNTNGQAWLAQCSWEQPPRLEGQLSLVLPAWTNQHANWTTDVQPGLRIDAKCQAGAGAYRGLRFDSAQTSVSLSNLVWRVADLRVTRPEGKTELDYTWNGQTRDYHYRVRSRIDPRALKPWLTKEAQPRVLDDLVFSEPPAVEAEIWGRARASERLGVLAKVAVTNLSFRGQAVQDCVATIQFTNNYLTFTDVEVRRPEGRATAPWISYDLVEQKLYLTNVSGALDQEAVMKALGPAVSKSIAPYRFAAPPTVRINGVFDLKKNSGTDDAHFDVEGGPFQWRHFHLTRVAGRVDWVGKTVTVTNVHGLIHNGPIAGHAFFDFAPAHGTDFSFRVAVTNADLHGLMADLTTRTNKLEGLLDGELIVTAANTSDPKSWQGRGHASLRDGLIWEFPIFGIFSSVLNTISDGLGNSRARQGAAAFSLTNSVIYSKNLEVHMMGGRLRYEGAVDFQGGVKGTMEAELFRNVPIFGPVIRAVLWPVSKVSAYKITGTLAKPKADPIFLPKFLLHPFKSLKDLLPGEPKSAEENKPAKPTPP